MFRRGDAGPARGAVRSSSETGVSRVPRGHRMASPGEEEVRHKDARTARSTNFTTCANRWANEARRTAIGQTQTPQTHQTDRQPAWQSPPTNRSFCAAGDGGEPIEEHTS